jgi:hypothetical protein
VTLHNLVLSVMLQAEELADYTPSTAAWVYE